MTDPHRPTRPVRWFTYLTGWSWASGLLVLVEAIRRHRRRS